MLKQIFVLTVKKQSLNQNLREKQRVDIAQDRIKWRIPMGRLGFVKVTRNFLTKRNNYRFTRTAVHNETG
jgi:hypothetical protein